MKDFALTETQRRLAEEKHSVLERFLLERNLPMEEFYDDLVFAFLNAVRIFDICNGNTNSFESIACICLTQALEKCKVRKKRTVETLSLDALLPGSKLRIADALEDPNMDLCNMVCNKFGRNAGKRYRISHKPIYMDRSAVTAI